MYSISIFMLFLGGDASQLWLPFFETGTLKFTFNYVSQIDLPTTIGIPT